MTWGWSLLWPNSMFWDDWVIDGTDTQAVYSENGLPWMASIVTALFKIGPVAFKLVALASILIVGVCAYSIAGRGLSLGGWERWVLAAVITIAPLNATRVSSAVLITYTLSLAAFFIAWSILVARGSRWPRWALALTSAPFSFASFTTASLLPFMMLPVIHVALLTPGIFRIDWRTWARFLATYWPVIVAPPAYWVVKSAVSSATGLYSTYNGIRVPSWPLSVAGAGIVACAVVFAAAVTVLLLRAHRGSQFRAKRGLPTVGALSIFAVAGLIVLAGGITSPGEAVVPIALVVCGLMVAAPVFFAQRDASASDWPGVAAVLGVAVVSLGALPYLLVGKVPSYIDWETRHQFLLAIGLAIIVLAAIRGVSLSWGKFASQAVSLGLVAVFLFVGASMTVELGRDWQKQDQIIAELAGSPVVAEAATVVFVDRSVTDNFDAREFRFYEYTGWLTAAFGKETRLGLGAEDVPRFTDGSMDRLIAEAERFGFGEWSPRGDFAIVQITRDAGGQYVVVADAVDSPGGVKQ